MLFIYQILLIGALVGESIVVLNTLHYVHQFDTIVAKLGSGASVPMTDIEASFGNKFDPFFYGASSSCKGNEKYCLSVHTNFKNVVRIVYFCIQHHCMRGFGHGSTTTVRQK